MKNKMNVLLVTGEWRVFMACFDTDNTPKKCSHYRWLFDKQVHREFYFSLNISKTRQRKLIDSAHILL